MNREDCNNCKHISEKQYDEYSQKIEFLNGGYIILRDKGAPPPEHYYICNLTWKRISEMEKPCGLRHIRGLDNYEL